MKLTKQQIKDIELLESTENYSNWLKEKNYLKQAYKKGDITITQYYVFDGTVYHVKETYNHFEADTDIISGGYPYKKQVIKINHQTYKNRT